MVCERKTAAGSWLRVRPFYWDYGRAINGTEAPAVVVGLRVSDSTQAGVEPASSLQRQVTVLSVGSDWVDRKPSLAQGEG